MIKHALFVRLEAKSGKEKDLAEFLRASLGHRVRARLYDDRVELYLADDGCRGWRSQREIEVSSTRSCASWMPRPTSKQRSPS
jgi:hypothetical protein